MVQHLLLVQINEDPAAHRIPDAGALDLARLEYHVAVRQHHRPAQASQDGRWPPTPAERPRRRTDTPGDTPTCAAGADRRRARCETPASCPDNRRARIARADPRISPSSAPGRLRPNACSKRSPRSAPKRSLSSNVLSTSSRKTTLTGSARRRWSPFFGSCQVSSPSIDTRRRPRDPRCRARTAPRAAGRAIPDRRRARRPRRSRPA